MPLADALVGQVGLADTLIAQLVADVTEFANTVSPTGQTVERSYPYLPNSFEGASPVLTVEAGDMFPRLEPAPQNETQAIIGVWVARETYDANNDKLDRREAAETLFVQLNRDVIQSIYNFRNFRLFQASLLDYAPMDGLDYRLAWHFVVDPHWRGA